MTPPPILLIYPFGLQNRDGTTVQLRRLLDDYPASVWHLHGKSRHRLSHPPPNYVSLELPLEPAYPFRRGGGFVRRCWRRWIVPIFVRNRISAAERRSGEPCPSVAYVIIYDELNAIFALAALRAAGVSHYALHLMDLFHDRFEPSKHAALARLIENASRVLVTSQRLANEVSASARRPLEVMPLLTGFYETRNPRPRTDARPYLLMTGALYAADPRKLSYLHDVIVPAWRRLRTEIPPIAWLYCGADSASMPRSLLSWLEDRGTLDSSAFSRILAEARCALLPIVHHADSHYRYSVPSRLIDYLTAGIPVVSCSAPGTATGDFLEDYLGRGVLVANTAREAYEALRLLFTDDAYHRELSAAARHAAVQFSAKLGRDHLQQVLQVVSGDVTSPS